MTITQRRLKGLVGDFKLGYGELKFSLSVHQAPPSPPSADLTSGGHNQRSIMEVNAYIVSRNSLGRKANERCRRVSHVKHALLIGGVIP